MVNKYVGQRVKRTEDPRLIKGLAHYVDDIRLPDTLHVSFVRSVYAHARINGIDASEALNERRAFVTPTDAPSDRACPDRARDDAHAS